jgi:hypothetical protein
MLKYRQKEDINIALPYSYNQLFIIILSFDVIQSELFKAPFIIHPASCNIVTGLSRG